MSNHKKFIAIHYFQPFYDSVADLFADESIEKFILDIQSEKGQEICNAQNFSDEDINDFFVSLRKPSTIVFQGWIEYKAAVFNLLTDNPSLDIYMDNFGHLDHKLSEEYRSYLSPYIAPRILERIPGSNNEELEKLFSFSPLLDKDHAIIVESELIKPILALIQDVQQKVETVKDEQKLIDEVSLLCADEIIHSINYLSRGSYSTKIKYVDKVLDFIKHPACTVRFANWVLKKMERIELNKEHHKKINDLKIELKEGTLQTKNNGKKKAVVFGMSRVILLLFVGILISGAIYLIVEKPFNEVQEQTFTSETSFTQFSKEERLKLDSLMKNMNGLQRANEIEFDLNTPLTGESAQLTMQKEIPNEFLNDICIDLLKYAELKLQGYLDTCVGPESYKRIKGVLPISDKKGNFSAMIKSDSEYDVIVFIASSHKKGEVYASYLKKNENMKLKVNEGDLMVAVPGNNFQAINIPQSLDKKISPSDTFKSMFCEIDMNTVNSTMLTYQFSNCYGNTNKFLITGHHGGNFQVVDMYGVLEEY